MDIGVKMVPSKTRKPNGFQDDSKHVQFHAIFKFVKCLLHLKPNPLEIPLSHSNENFLLR